MRYRSLASHSHNIRSPHGSDIYVDLVRSKDKNGVDCLIKGCEHKISDELRAAARGCDLESIVKRSFMGDVNAIRPVSDDSFADVTKMPTSLVDAEMQIIRARETFDSLPLDLRERYGFNAMKFCQALADGSYFKLIAKKSADNSSSTLSKDEIAALKKIVAGGSSNA